VGAADDIVSGIDGLLSAQLLVIFQLQGSPSQYQTPAM
jgi:hypothetical protein